MEIRLPASARRAVGPRLLWALLAACLATAAGGQPLTILRVDFEFSNPGARSLGFGGAFAALADDATAAYANPAGLGQLVEPEVSVELRSWNRSVPYLSGGRVDGVPTGIGLDVEPGPVESVGGENATEVSFLSYVLPRGRWSVAFYHHQLARFEVETESQGQFFDLFPGAPFRFPATRERLDLDVTATGAAASWKVSEALSVGLGAVYVDGGLTSRSDIFFPFDGNPESLFEPVGFTPEELTGRFTADIDDSAVAVRLGLLWRPAERWSAAAFYRQGADLDGRLSQRSGVLGEEPEEPVELATELRIPEVLGLGLAYRDPDGRWTWALEVDRIQAEALLRLEDDGGSGGSAEEYHLGGEYAFVRGRKLIAWRGGLWYDSRPQGLVDDDGTLHYAVGFGFAGERLQVDVGADFSEVVDTFAVSTIYRF